MPRVSVLIPVRDGGATLDQALDSLAAQTFRDFEIVAVDDGSTDDTGRRLQACALREPRLRVIGLARSSGIAGALNQGLGMCRGDFVARMDADDLAHPERLAAQVAFADAHPAIGVVATLVEGCTVEGGPVAGGMARYIAWSNALITPEAIAHARFIESPLVHPSVLMRRQILADGFRVGDFPEDYDLWLRLLAAGVRMAKVPRVLLQWRDRPARATRIDARYGPTRHRALKMEHLLAGPLSDRARPIVFWGAGMEGKPFLRALFARGRPARVVVELDPRKIGQTIHGSPVVSQDALDRALAQTPGAVVLVAVGVPRARGDIRAFLESRNLQEGQDFWFLR